MNRVALCLLVALPSTLSADVNQDAIDVLRLVGQWQVAEAERVMQRLRRSAPNEAIVTAIGGVLRFHQGAYGEAAQTIQLALDKLGKDAPSRLRPMARLARRTAKQTAAYVARKSDGGHFLIRVSPGRDELLLPFAADTLETIRERIGQDLGYRPPDVIRVEIYPTPKILSRVSPLSAKEIERTGTVALCKYNRLMVVTPRALLRGYSWRDTLAHEYVHLVVSRLSHNRVPVWLQEGLAKFYETRWRQPAAAPSPLTPAQEHFLAEALRRKRLVPWADMHPSMAKLPNQRTAALAFAQVQTAISWLAQRHGRSALRRLIDMIDAKQSPWKAISTLTGLSRRRFDRAYRRFLVRKRLRRYAGISPGLLRFGRRPSREKQLADLRQDSLRRHLRLADMLRQRRRRKAAIIEYRRALRIAGPRMSLIANALSRTYLEVEQPSQAMQTLAPVLEYYPELPGPQVTAGLAQLARGDKAQATEHFLVALRINPFDPELHCGLGRSLPPGVAAQRHRRLCEQLTAQ